MNAIERSERRVKRLVVLKRIYEIEQKNCKVCPNRSSYEPGICMKCPVPAQLQELGMQLSSLSDRTNVEKIKEEPNVKYEIKLKLDTEYHFARGKMRKRRKPLTEDEVISGIAKHGTASALARALGLPETTVRHRAYAYGLAGLKGKQALEMLKNREEIN